MAIIQRRESILKAIEEFDSLGREQFLKRYRFGPSKHYFLVHGGKRYDSKPIVGVAYGYENPTHGPLNWRELYGGFYTVKKCLEDLGFEVQIDSPPVDPSEMPPVHHPESILKAIEEFDLLGRDQFLERYGFGPAKRYFLVHGGKTYDSKAIVGVAYGYENPPHGPLKSQEFNGGRDTVQDCLERLGFEVEVKEPEPEP
ncbi:MAG: hypothetical protein ACYC61_23160 [Isosphaeraceae bacterium]